MLQFEVDIDDLTNSGIDAVLSAHFLTGAKPYTSAWEVTGPLIEHWGICLDYQSNENNAAAKVLAEIKGQDELQWSSTLRTDQDTFYCTGETALVAASKSLVCAICVNGRITLPGEQVARFVKDEWVLIRAIIQDSDYHEASSLPGKVNSYTLIPMPGREALQKFQAMVTLIESLNGLQIERGSRESESGLGYVSRLEVTVTAS